MELTFDAVDDLVGAQARGRLGPAPAGQIYSPIRLGPLVELAFAFSDGRRGPLLSSPWLDSLAHADFRQALSGQQDLWFDSLRRRGFLRTVFDPCEDLYEVNRTSFLMGADIAAKAAGFPVSVAQSLAAAIREMESNIYEHSGRPESGLLAYSTGSSSFEFAIADCGRGVLDTLQEAPEHGGLADHGRALYLALQEGTSRYGKSANRGMGFRDLFIGISRLNADLRFRSGDHALTLKGIRTSLTTARLSQKPFYQGLFASVRCELPPGSAATH
jgi:hypothetical protein